MFSQTQFCTFKGALTKHLMKREGVKKAQNNLTSYMNDPLGDFVGEISVAPLGNQSNGFSDAISRYYSLFIAFLN